MLAMTDDRNKIANTALAQMAEIDAQRVNRIKESAEANRLWNLVMIGPAALKVATQLLTDAGLELYTPQIRDMVPPRSNQLPLAQRKYRKILTRERLSPIFGSYRFVHVDINNDPWHGLFETARIYGLQCAGGLPVPMPDEFIHNMKAKEINGAIPGSTLVKALIFSPGDRAKINDGPLVGFEGTISHVDERGRIKLLLEMFAGITSFDLSADELDKVSTK